MFSLFKFFAGFNIFNGEKLAKLVFYAILIAVGIGIYHKTFIAKTQTTKIANIEKYIVCDCEAKNKFTLLKIFKFRLLTYE